METLWVDFQNSGCDGVRLICNRTLQELKQKNIALEEGLSFLIWSDDVDENGNPDNLFVNATIKYSDIDKCWIAQIDEADLKNESERKH